MSNCVVTTCFAVPAKWRMRPSWPNYRHQSHPTTRHHRLNRNHLHHIPVLSVMNQLTSTALCVASVVIHFTKYVLACLPKLMMCLYLWLLRQAGYVVLVVLPVKAKWVSCSRHWHALTKLYLTWWQLLINWNLIQYWQPEVFSECYTC